MNDKEGEERKGDKQGEREYNCSITVLGIYY